MTVKTTNYPEFTKDNSLPLEVVDEEKGIVEGYASVYGVIDSQNEIVEKGAFDHILNDPTAIKKIKFLWQHQYDKPIGRIQKLWDDGVGLKYRAKYNQKTSWGKDAYEASLNEDIDGNSIGYSMTNGKAAKDDEGINHLQNVGLMEISNVTFPSNQEATHTGVKSETVVEELETKAGRVLSSQNESDLRKAAGLITGVLDQVGSNAPTPAAAPAKPAAPGKDTTELETKLTDLIKLLRG